MILRNFDFASQYIINYENREVINRDNSDLLKINGWYKNVKDGLSALLVSDYKLFFLFNDKKYDITDEYHVNLKRGNSVQEKILELMKNDESIFIFFYNIEQSVTEISPFEYIDTEDSDWGIFIQNRVNNIDKKNNFLEILME